MTIAPTIGSPATVPTRTIPQPGKVVAVQPDYLVLQLATGPIVIAAYRDGAWREDGNPAEAPIEFTTH
jgi:hypothetical protein